MTSTRPGTVKESERIVDVVVKATSILDCFLGNQVELSLNDITQKTGMYKSRIIRLCGSLTSQEYLIRTASSRFKLGPKLMMLGKIYERSNPLVSLARPVLRDLASVTGESAKLFVIEGKQRMCLARELGHSRLHYVISEGELLPLYMGAGGKVLLAYAPEDFRKQVLDMAVAKKSQKSIVSRARLEEELATVRKQGYVITSNELSFGVSGIAAPVFDHANAICASLTVAGAISRFTVKRSRAILRNVIASAFTLSNLLGYMGEEGATGTKNRAAERMLDRLHSTS
jgi:DNA-binding IclR family transcriptional regulator